MKQIIISQKQFHQMAGATMTEYTDKMKSHEDDEHKYTRMNEISDVLTMSIAFSLLECKLFNIGGESDESNEQ